MVTFIIAFIIALPLIALIDTAFGNKLCPGKVEIIKLKGYSRDRFIIRRKIRILLIPNWKYALKSSYQMLYNPTLEDWGKYQHAYEYEMPSEEVITLAQQLLGRPHSQDKQEIIWTSTKTKKRKKALKPKEQDIVELGHRLIKEKVPFELNSFSDGEPF